MRPLRSRTCFVRHLLRLCSWIGVQPCVNSMSDQTDPATTVTPSTFPGNLIARHWRGEETLSLSYWRNVWGAGVCWKVSALIADSLYVPTEPHGIAVEIVGLWVYFMAVPLFVWGLVGLWRSASRHPGRGGSRFWAIAAKAFVVVSVLAAIGSMAPDTPR